MEIPRSMAQARKSPNWKEWDNASKEEWSSLMKNHTWDLIDKPDGARVVGSKWLYTIKSGIPGVELKRFKCRLVAQGFSQTEGVDYNEIFSPVVKHVSIRIMLSAVVNRDYELEQMDVKTAFLHGDLEREF
ncbi:unnamed protein product [Microthlaspi erraticum]|uniref:Reverse transcriptase Ty1/copia-type domain-containing protein n=1 Tax=Microthlaspi erraticum TaxID=1685480 RepID=A0A6D2JNC7_9BRAS|nr:unnamed protein product [Microthlaspi erraticum]